MSLMRGRHVVVGVVMCVASVMLLGNWEGARGVVILKQLANWNTGVLGGKASLVTQCAKGNDAACDALVSDPGAVAALQNIDAKNPQGFAAKHPHKAATLEKKFEMGHPPQMLRGPPRAVGVTRRSRRASVERVEVEQPRGLQQQQVAHRVPEPLSYYKKNREARKRREDAFDREFGRMHAATRVPEPLSQYGKGFTGVEKGYKTARSTAKEWQLPAWKDGALGGGNTQWLKACAEGNYYACGQLEKSNDDIHDVLKPKHKIRPAVKTTASVPKAVFVTQKPSVWGQIMKAIGLGDSYYKNTERTGTVPKMEPDSGLAARGHAGVYNDGTVAGFLSDQTSQP